ncbi:respiratory burst oxidase homolog protein B [Physcomitrium patens]|uniref:respiratory burst oxidase homolog protein B n=1 Tax=Physcomitrium patens TaxID=3218 RepID=UPI000D158C62|nr:respiratory burst oxidase homolog protein B-like [Physcomitrium patens]|eukprot:XP_024361705.1 respiratory burst oxidase homolog protein B-like [Physcomitrella patens]
MDKSRASSIVRLMSRESNMKRSFKSDEVLLDLRMLEAECSGSAKSPVEESEDVYSKGNAMLELNFEVSQDHVTLRSVIPAANSELPLLAAAEIHAREKCDSVGRESRPSNWGNSMSAIVSGSRASCSTSFRESFITVGNMVKQLSNEFHRYPRSASRVQDLDNSVDERGVLDSELGNCGSTRKMQKSTSRAEYAIKAVRCISKATATADQKKSWQKVEERFHKLRDADSMLPRFYFPECIGMKESKEFALELFDALVRRKGEKVNSISKDGLYQFWLEITDKSFDARMQMFFDLCDKDLDGRISGEEVKQVIMLSASANKLSKLKEQAAEYAALIMEELDVNRNGYIELSHLETLLRESVLPGHGKEATMNNHQLLIKRSKRSRIRSFAEKTRNCFQDNWKRLWILALWMMAMTGLFIWKFFQYREHAAFPIMGNCLCVAKGAAETLKLNMALVLLPVCRNTLTRLRSTRLGKIIPFDDNLDFHKIIAGGIAAGVFIHGVCHITCDIPKFVESGDDKFFKYLGDEFEKHPTYANIAVMPVAITGILMVVFMIIAFLLATHWFRRSMVKLPWPLQRLTGFNAFWYSHHLFVIVYALLMVHSIKLLLAGPWYKRTTWMYIAIPLLLYAGERMLRLYRTNSSKVEIVKAAIYTGNVLAIHITKPQGFKYKSGMYLFLQCPQISSFEWHPFSITSAPGDPFLSVHIRTLGDWTAEMKKIFSEACGGRTCLQTINNYGLSGELTLAARFPKLFVDGPYGAPAQDYLKYDVLLLVGLGIGATPFISILKDMLHHTRYDLSDPSLTPSLRPTESPKKKKKSKRKPKAYFYWVTREQGSFDWFRGIMREVEEIDNKESIEMHNYLTSVYEEGDARSTLVTMLQSLYHAKNGVDLVSGTRARTHFARPNWKDVFANLTFTHPEKRIGVFYCGPAALVNELETLSRTYTKESSTKFSFHKENF